MSSTDSVTGWIEALKAGDSAAASKLAGRYLHQLAALARKKLSSQPRLLDYDEDVALSAFTSLVRGAECGQFPQLLDREHLWRLLVVITLRKAIDVLRKEGRRPPVTGADVEQLLSDEPPPELAMQVEEEYRRLLDLLGDDELRAIALWKMEGLTNEAIAARLGCVPRTVERRLYLIRRLWARESEP